LFDATFSGWLDGPAAIFGTKILGAISSSFLRGVVWAVSKINIQIYNKSVKIIK